MATRLLAALGAWVEKEPFELLGPGPCAGDDLWRGMSYMTASLPQNTTGFKEASALACMDFCNAAVNYNFSRCMGFEVDTARNCKLFDRDWKNDEKAFAELVMGASLLPNVTTHFSGIHLIRFEDDEYILKSLSAETACYRRTVACSSAPDCAALGRYDCKRGKLENTCDLCQPRRNTANRTGNAAGNTTCDSIVQIPTLRISFGTATFKLDDRKYYEGYNDALYGSAFTYKHAWEMNDTTVIPIPLHDRQNFNIELVGFCENKTKTVEVKAGGTEEVNPDSAMTGTSFIVGAANTQLTTRLQIRQTTPPGEPVHAVIGTFESETAEIALSQIGTQFRTPVIGFAMTSSKFADRDKHPYYIRSNKVALEPGRAIARLLQNIGYTKVFVFEQMLPAESFIAHQILEGIPGARVITEGPPRAERGACTGDSRPCAVESHKAWTRLRNVHDARIIVHEKSTSVFELLMALGTNLIGKNTLYIQSGVPCEEILVWETLTSVSKMATFYAATNKTSNCTPCVNLAKHTLNEEQRKNNMTWIAAYLFDPSRHTFYADNLKTCPQFPDEMSLASCPYCDGRRDYFVHPDCHGLMDQFLESFSQSLCVQADTSKDGLMFQKHATYLYWLGGELASRNRTEGGLLAAARLLSAGMPKSYVGDYLPGGRMWNIGLNSTLNRPMSWTARWDDHELGSEVNKRMFANFGDVVNSLPDALLTVIVGYNEFVRLGGDVDYDSSASASATKNGAAYGFKKLLLGARFDGRLGHVEYMPNGERNIKYKVYQLVEGNKDGCYSKITLVKHINANNASGVGEGRAASLQGFVRHVAGEMNFASVDETMNLSGILAPATKSNLEGCNPHALGAFDGKIALVRRGSCYFVTKVLHAQVAGATGIVIVNHASSYPIMMGSDDPHVNIPGISLGKDVGLALIDEVYNNQRQYHIIFAGSSRCIDPRYIKTEGRAQYARLFDYFRGDDVILSNVSSMRFNSGSSTPPLQEPLPCKAGYSYNLHRRECQHCPAGRYSPVGGKQCFVCQAGRYQAHPGSQSCTLCKLGKFSDEGAPACKTCPLGRVAAREGCRDCPAGSVPSDSFGGKRPAVCTYCLIGKYANRSGATACDTCPIQGSVTARGATSITDCLCPTSFFPHEPARKCIPYFALGILLPFMEKPQYLAALSMLELDLQANIDMSVHSGLPAPIVPMHNISELLRLQLYVRNTGGMSDLAMRGLIELAGGQSNYKHVHGVVGAYDSSVSIPTASLGKMLKTTQISHSSTSSELSNKELYPFFLRTIPPDIHQGKALWAYFMHFDFAVFVLIDESDVFAESVYNAAQGNSLSNRAFNGKISYHRLLTVHDVVDYVGAVSVVRAAVQTGGRLLVLVVRSSSVPTLRRALFDCGVWAPEYQFLWSDSGRIVSNVDLPLGTHALFTDYSSAQQTLFRQAFAKLTLEDFAGHAAKSRWRVDAWDPVGGVFDISAIEEAWVQQREMIDPYVYLFFDACYSFLHAYNQLLRQGVEPMSIQSSSLLGALKDIEFNGLTGKVSFDRNGDRIMNYSLLNLQSITVRPEWVLVGVYDIVANNLVLLNVSKWMDNSSFATAPEKLRGCQQGFVKVASGCNSIPDPTDCTLGQGIVDASGVFLEHHNESGAASCKFCEPGSMSRIISEGNQDTYVCSVCGSGKFQKHAGSTAPCEDCEEGKFSNSTGQTSCQRCPVGTYVDSIAASGCLRCHDREVQVNPTYAHDNELTTSYEGSTNYSDCRCENGTYRSHGDENVCVKCPPETVCPVGSQQVTADPRRAPKLKEGYMAFEVDGRPEIFRCMHLDSCTGGRRLFILDGSLNLDTMCQNFSKGKACALCKDDAYSRNGRCRPCGGLPFASPFILITATGVAIGAACLAFYYGSMFPPNPINMAFGCFFTLFQSISVITGYSVILGGLWGELTMSSSQILGLDLTMLNLPTQCVRHMDFLTTYGLQVFWVTELWFMFGLLFFSLRMLHRLLVTIRPQRTTAADWLPSGRIVSILDRYCKSTFSEKTLATRVQWFFDAQSADMINAAVKITQVLYITIAKTSMTVFRFEAHPSGVETLQAFPDVVVRTDEWWRAVLISSAGLVVLCVGFLAFFVCLVICAPRRYPADEEFRNRFRGLWSQFDPSSWWFGIVHLLYGLLLNITPACLHNARAQIMSGSVINSVYILVTCHVQPWRWHLNHHADVILKIAFGCFLVLTMGGDVGEEFPETTTNVFMSIAVVLPSCFVILILIRHVWMARIDKLAGYAQRAEFTQKFLDLSNIVNGMRLSKLRAMTTELLDRDVQSLDQALDSLQYALLGLQPNSIFRRRAGLKPFEICRPGRLEGEVLARGLAKKGDGRRELRLLQQALRIKLSISEDEFDESWRTWSDVKSDLLHTRIQRRLRQLFKVHDRAEGVLNKEEFSNFMHKAIAHWKGPNGERLSKSQLEDIFDYIDIYQGGTLTITECCHAMHDLPDPIYPCDHKDQSVTVKEFLYSMHERSISPMTSCDTDPEVDGPPIDQSDDKDPEFDEPVSEQHRCNMLKLQQPVRATR